MTAHTFETAPPRLSLAALAAAPLVYGLFLVANGLITVDEISLTEKVQRPIPTLTPKDDPFDLPQTIKVEIPEVLSPPPPLPKQKVETQGSAPVFEIIAPQTDTKPISFKPGPISTSPVAGRNIQVVRAPAPSIPAIAVSRGISGSCEVLFDVDTRGRPFNLTATCTDDIFKAEAIRSVSKAEFLPKVNKSGVLVEQQGAIYPLEFKVE